MDTTLQIEIGQYSAPGMKPQNEDFYGAIIPTDSLLEKKGICLAIADGMSGSDGAKEASQLAIKMFLNDYYSTPDSWSVKQSVLKVMTALNNWLYHQGQQRYDSPKGLVTTFSAIVLKSCTAHIFHVGDSRIFRIRENKLEQLTRDHRIRLSAEKTYLSRALGIDIHLDIDYCTELLKVDDLFVLSTDGVHDFIQAHDMVDLIFHNDELQTAAEAIVRVAKTHSDDNLTIQIMKISQLAKASKDEFFQKLTELPFPPELSTGHILDHYKIIRELNTSSRSQVYLACDLLDSNKTHVVLKTPSVNYEDDMTYIDLFLHEEWVAKRLNSPHIIKPHDADRTKTFLYCVVEYIEGQTLKQWISDNPNPSIVVVRDMIDQIARGLRAMHRLEMIHQDLKPDNILIDSDRTLKIIDLASTKIKGLAEIKTVVTSQIVATLDYSAPECFLQGISNNQADIYSLGIITYEMLSGKLPYGEIRQTTRLRNYHYQSILEVNATIPAWVDKAIEKAVHPDPAYRYQLLSEFIVDLSKPNQQLLETRKAPLIEENPLLFWQIISMFEFLLLLLLFYWFTK